MSNELIPIDSHADMLGNNIIVEGFPVHDHISFLNDTSLTHKMVAKAREALFALSDTE